MAKQKASLAVETAIYELNGLRVQLAFKKIKYLRLKIDRSAQIKLSAPLKTSQKMINAFLQKHEKWIQNTLQKTKQNDDKTSFLGQKYDLFISSVATGVKIEQNTITAPSIKAWQSYRDAKLKELIAHHIAIYQPKIDKTINRISYKNMSSRWGSCNHKKGYLNFSLQLANMATEFIEYVVWHELCHLIHPNHQAGFWQLLASYMPDFKARQTLAKSR